jgi:nucleoside 2-deoxyribosyltransferase
MRIYLAAPYAARAQVREYAAELERIGFTSSASWLEETHEINSGTTGAATDIDDAAVAAHASTDLRDIERSDALVLLTGNALGLDAAHSGSGGRHVETGYAIALAKPVLVVGEPENVFHRLGRACTVVKNWHEAIIELSARLVDLTAARDIVAAPVR